MINGNPYELHLSIKSKLVISADDILNFDTPRLPTNSAEILSNGVIIKSNDNSSHLFLITK